MEKRILLPLNILKRIFVERFVWTNSAYQKFVIISHGRSGSTYFRSLLNSHPQIRCYGELFNPVPKKTFFQPESFPLKFNETNQYLESLRRNDSIKFLKNYIWRKQANKFKGIGFKLFYYHAQEGPWAKVWEKILKDKSIKIIHLHRANRLKTYLSLEMARKYDKWHSNVKDPEPIQLDANLCKDFFEEFETYEQEIDKKFENHDTLKFYYEDLANDRDEVMSKVFSFLNLDPYPISSPMKKLKKKSMDLAISNYTLLKEEFSESSWKNYFTE